MSGHHVLVFDAQGHVSDQLRQRIRDDLDFSHATSVPEARLLLTQHPFDVALVVFDAHLLLQQEPLEQLMSGPAAAEWIALVEPDALACRELQSFVLRAFHDYHTLPLDPTRLAMTIGHACGKARLRVGLTLPKEAYAKFQIIGASPAMTTFFSRLGKVIHSDVPVLINGETGTGKELVAKAIHQHAQRASGPLVVVNCGAIPANLMQSELFGYEKGAFTGATQRQIGKIEAAHGGVLFLDEIGDLPLDMQASLLRVVQERSVTRIGSMQVIPVDFRVIAATHVDLRESIRQGRFREDLFFRLNVLHLELPPLRERGTDIILLAESVFKQYASKCKNSQVKGFSKEALRMMRAYDWPGNVRELINRVQRAMVMSENRLLTPADLGLESVTEAGLTLDHARATFDRHLLETCLRSNGHKVSDAARQLGVSRVTFYRMMNKLNILPKSAMSAGLAAAPYSLQER